MTLHANDNSNTEAVLLQDVLIQNTEDGTHVDDPIARVSYVQLDPSPDGQQNESDNEVNQVRDSKGSGDGLTVGLGLGLAIAGAAIVVTAGVLHIRRKKSQNDDDTTVPPILNSYLFLDPVYLLDMQRKLLLLRSVFNCLEKVLCIILKRFS
jgi:hypothetical protein